MVTAEEYAKRHELARKLAEKQALKEFPADENELNSRREVVNPHRHKERSKRISTLIEFHLSKMEKN